MEDFAVMSVRQPPLNEEQVRERIAQLRAATWRAEDPRASSNEKALMKLCGLAADSLVATYSSWLRLKTIEEANDDLLRAHNEMTIKYGLAIKHLKDAGAHEAFYKELRRAALGSESPGTTMVADTNPSIDGRPLFNAGSESERTE